MIRVTLLALALAAVLAACQTAAPPPSPEPVAQAATEIATQAATDDPFAEDRAELLAALRADPLITDPHVLEALAAVPRHEFVPPEHLGRAYGNYPLTIGYGQTISQPLVVAWMTQALELEPDDVVLEIGTGSGYQAAVLSAYGVAHVYTIEIIGPLAEQAAARLERLGYANVTVRHADGYFGWEEHAPFDAIIVTAAPDHAPPPLLEQLAEGGHMVIPIGPVGAYQSLWLFTKENGEITSQNLGGVAFVPLTRQVID
jgi:protein-L-isoaspartate(D-aspartate) O-methyltransferase